MKYRDSCLGIFSVVVIALLCIPMTSLQAQNSDYVVPRTEYGQPDLNGVWNFSSFVPMQRPAQFADKAFLTPEDIELIAKQTEAGLEALNNIGVGGYNTFWVESAGRGDNTRTSLIVYPLNGRLPETVEGVSVQIGGLGPDEPCTRPVRMAVGGIAKDGPEDRGTSERCIVGFNAGPPFTPALYNNNVQLVQGKDHVVIITEMIHDARIVPLDGRAHIDDSIRQWSGDSRGYWDGDTLVVETRNFNDLSQSFSVFGSSYDKQLTEKFSRVDEFTLNYEFTVDDPSTFKDKITAIVPMAKLNGLMYEYACHEGNYGMANILRGERMQEQRAKASESGR